MAQPNSRETFKTYCLQKLGEPVMKINVDEGQVQDRIDEALSMYVDYHYSATTKEYYKHEVTDTDKVNGYIDIPENIIGVVKIVDAMTYLDYSTWHSATYQYMWNEMGVLGQGDISSFMFAQEQLGLIKDYIMSSPMIRYNRNVNRLYIDTDWETIPTGNWFVIEAAQVVDPETFTDVWKERWLQNYATALINLQWGTNLSLYTGMQLPGGLTIDGAKILDDAKSEVSELEVELKDNYVFAPFDMEG